MTGDDVTLRGEPLDARWQRELSDFLDAVESETLPYEAQLPFARRFAWEQEKSQRVPMGYWLRHECGNRVCVNPEHAELIPIGE